MAGVRVQKKKNRLRLRERVGVAVLGTVLTLCVLIVGTVAYLQREATLENQFTVGTVDSEVIETFEDNVKSDVRLKNTGTADAYLRATVLIYFEDKDGNVLGEVPKENDDYTIRWGESANWLKADNGYYYYKSPIQGNTETDSLIVECHQNKVSSDRRLVVDVLGQAIQAQPIDAVSDAWGSEVSVKDDGTLTLKSGD